MHRRLSPQSFVVQIQRRVYKIEEKSKRDTQNLRSRCLDELEPLFSMASLIARGEKPDQADEDNKPVTMRERQLWAHVAAHVAEVMGDLSKGFDEREFNDDLAELERQVKEIEDLQDQTDKKENRRPEGPTKSKDPEKSDPS